jgi:hypothetical protein
MSRSFPYVSFVSFTASKSMGQARRARDDDHFGIIVVRYTIEMTFGLDVEGFRSCVWQLDKPWTFLVLCVATLFLPSQIPFHFDYRGEAGWYGSKYLILLFTPVPYLIYRQFSRKAK